MQCSDLDRYLEAFLDGRLGRSRGALMRRHVATCLACRTRIEKLKQFERELARRFRSLERCEAIWSTLEVDLVRSTTHPAPLPEMPVMRALPPPREPGRLPPPPPVVTDRPRRRQQGRRRFLGPLAGVLLITAALGTVYQLGMTLLGPRAGGPMALAPAGLLTDGRAPDFASGDSERLRRWLVETTGTDYPLPPQPDGFSLLGGSLDRQAGGEGAVLLYGHGDATTMLHIRPRGTAMPTAADLPGLSQMRWEGPHFRYEVTSPLPPEELEAFERLLPAGS
ncbi:zf-HC2 domain-containing protein [Geminicoccaceae bacterium 1502E]|nr:zf-HC2 domain-containing protein [Geminicoccaceae bacterium 1502E]